MRILPTVHALALRLRVPLPNAARFLIAQLISDAANASPSELARLREVARALAPLADYRCPDA